MIRRALMLVAVGGMCASSIGYAADLPLYPLKKPVPQRQVRLAKPALKVAAKPATQKKMVAQPLPVAPAAVEDDMNLVWVLDPLVANSDGAKKEDSASIETNLVVTEPGHITQPMMTIELSGHVVKTLRTTARIDVRIGKSYRTVAWTVDDVQAGKFKISLDEPVKAGKLPDYYPVSALAFVTSDGKDSAAMISLEKVVVRVGKTRVATAKKDPAAIEATGSISKN
jgi:hypothetical protein